MLLLISAAILVLGIILMVIYENSCSYNEWQWGIGLSAIMAGGSITAIMVICMIFSGIVADANIATGTEEYNELVYICEEPSLRDEFGLLNKEYFDEICDWNQTITLKQAMDHNLWVGIAVPNYWDDFELIELDEIVYTNDD